MRLPDIPPERLGWLRILVGSYAVIILLASMPTYVKVADTDPAMFRGLGLTSLLEAPLPPGLFLAIVGLTVALGVAFVLGWRMRVVGPLFAVLLLFVTTYRTSWVQIYHSDNLLALQVLALGLAPATGDRVSLDHRAGRVPERQPWEYAWPVLLVCAVTTITYLIAGAAKVAGSAGWEWALGSNLRDQIAYDALNKELLGLPPSAAAAWAFQHPVLLRPGSIGAILLELGAPLALLHRHLGRAWAIGTCGMHWGIYILMGIAFDYPLSGIAFAAFFPLERLGDLVGWLRGRAA